MKTIMAFALLAAFATFFAGAWLGTVETRTDVIKQCTQKQFAEVGKLQIYCWVRG